MQNTFLFKLKNLLSSNKTNAPARPVITPLTWRRTLRFQCDFESDIEGNVPFNELLDTQSFVLPGLRRMQVGEDICTYPVYQGICCDEEYLYLASYCHCQEKGYKHDSALHILHKRNGHLIGTVPIERCHVGGVAVDEKSGFLFVCNSRKKQMMVYKRNLILRAAAEHEQGEKMSPDAVFSTGVTPSFCTCYDGVVWTGAFSKEDTTLLGYVCEDGAYVKKYKLDFVPPLAQGVSFYRRHGQVHVSFSVSYGRRNPSYLKTLLVVDYDDAFVSGKTMHLSQRLSVKMPAMMEEIQYDGEHLYAVFESASKTYRPMQPWKRSLNPCDRICRMRLDVLEQLCAKVEKDSDFKKKTEY